MIKLTLNAVFEISKMVTQKLTRGKAVKVFKLEVNRVNFDFMRFLFRFFFPPLEKEKNLPRGS